MSIYNIYIFSIQITIPSRKPLRSKACSDAKRSLFSGKRLAEEDDIVDASPAPKKSRNSTHQSQCAAVIEAVDRLSNKRELVADGSRGYCLPTIPGKHDDLKSISTETMSDVLDGKYSKELGDVTIVDCRYPYEFEGGHIKGAVNMYTKDAVNSLLQKPSDKRHVIIFHCEFSSERGPKM